MTAVLGSPTAPLRPRWWRRHPLGRSLPSSALCAATGVLITAGAVPGVDAELVLAGLGLACLGPIGATPLYLVRSGIRTASTARCRL